MVLRTDQSIIIYFPAGFKGQSAEEDGIRKKFTENELKELLEEFKFKIVFKMYTEEPDRNKKWLTYIVEKVE